MRRTKIVATIGPASREPHTLMRMVEAGMDVARLNYSHGTLDEHAETVRRLRDAAGRAGRPIAILQDLPGPKLRIGPLHEDVVELTPGEHLTFTCGDGDVAGDAHDAGGDGVANGGGDAEPDAEDLQQLSRAQRGLLRVGGLRVEWHDPDARPE